MRIQHLPVELAGYESIIIQRKSKPQVLTSKHFLFYRYLSIYDSSRWQYVFVFCYIRKMSICAYKLTAEDITLSGIRTDIFP